MDKNKNYYNILGIEPNSDKKEIKKAYYKLSFKFHPDINNDTDILNFNEITEAYNVLSDYNLRYEYDLKSKWGNNYNEYFELFDTNIDINYDDVKKKKDTFKKNEINNIYIEVADDFNGNLEYERWVKCKSCDGTGRDLSSRIVIKDKEGNITKVFDADDGCDFCDGTGIDYNGVECHFCQGKGKVGINKCKNCNGERRILGKQKLNNIKIIDDDITKIDVMGHFSKSGKIGNLYILKKRQV